MGVLFTATLIWLIRFEIFSKMISIDVSDNGLLVERLFFHRRRYDLNNLIGYETRINSTRLGNFEETIVLTNDNKVILSEFFIANYQDLKVSVVSKFRDFGGVRK